MRICHVYVRRASDVMPNATLKRGFSSHVMVWISQKERCVIKHTLLPGQETQRGITPGRLSCLVLSHLVNPSSGGSHSSGWLDVVFCHDRVGIGLVSSRANSSHGHRLLKALSYIRPDIPWGRPCPHVNTCSLVLLLLHPFEDFAFEWLPHPIAD